MVTADCRKADGLQTFQSVRPRSCAAMSSLCSKYGCRSPKHSKPSINIVQCRHTGYWLVTVACKDRNKLLFDTVRLPCPLHHRWSCRRVALPSWQAESLAQDC